VEDRDIYMQASTVMAPERHCENGLVMQFNKRHKKIFLRIVAVITIISIPFIVSCSGSGSSAESRGIPLPDVNVPADEVTETVSDLENGTAYYWQVTAEDGKGGKTYSPVWTFEAE
jgi:hypothetical protein